jgi:signal transduction histidine kinase
MKLIKKQKDDSTTMLETTKNDKPVKLQTWKVLVVDDEPDVHNMTKLSLKDFEFDGRCLQILQANSEQEARKILEKESDIAVALVDIVMETDDAGLSLINYIRNELEDDLIRIIIRTGQPGMFAEKDVIEQYDIDDYKNKAELNTDRLYFTMRMILKVYRHLLVLEKLNQNLELKVLERTEQLEEQNQCLQSLNQEKNEFLSIAAHDLKNPLQSIQGATEIIELIIKTDGSKEDAIEFTSMIHRNAKRMSNLIANLLNINALETGQFKIQLQQTNILPTLHKVISEYTEKARTKKITIYFTPKETEYMACTDHDILHQILDNLISNAVKYSPFEKHIFINIFNQEQSIRIEIKDQGQGLSSEDKNQLFGKFARLSAKPTNDEHSTGLGLFIVKKLVTVLNGEVQCESELGQGATFILTIPQTCSQ